MSGATGNISGRVPHARTAKASRSGTLALLEEAVPVEPFREAFERSGMTLNEFAREMGWMQPDSHMAKRRLGMTARNQTHVRRSTAEQMAEVLGLDPVDIGL